jgi:serine/threonine protein phosphatase PrpC
VLTHKLQKADATAAEIEKAMYLAALSQYCIFNPSRGDWPLRSGDPLHNASMTKVSCTLNDFQQALRARDPLGLGFESADLLLNLIWKLLTFDPDQRITAAEALRHPYFENLDIRRELKVAFDENTAVESQMLDPRMDFDLSDRVYEFTCPHCKKVFGDWQSCNRHANARKHAKFCVYDKSALPTCLNAHSMLPAHSFSGHCDIRGRRRFMEDFHSIHLLPLEQFYAILDGHNGNFASKFVASCLYEELAARVPPLKGNTSENALWKAQVEDSVRIAFLVVHEKLLDAVSLLPYVSMRQSGTTATLALVTNTYIVVASIGDSRAVLSSWREESSGLVGLSPIQLTKDHVASDELERRMVESRGGQIMVLNGLARVNGSLAITRSLGDASLSDVLSQEPHIVALSQDELSAMCGRVSERMPCFLIIASDGMWDTMTNQEAVDMVSEVISSSLRNTTADWRETAVLQHAAEALTLEAYARGSTDNIGVYIAALPLASMMNTLTLLQ